MVPPCLAACARFVRVSPDKEDLTQAGGPANSTTAGEQEAAAAATADAAELVKWLSVIDEDDADATEVSSLPSLQRLLERMETQAGRIMANEAYSVVEKGGFTALDELGRNRLLAICRDFHSQCKRSSPEDEAQQLLWRVQAIVNKRLPQHDENREGCPSDPAKSNQPEGTGETSNAHPFPQRPPLLRVLTVGRRQRNERRGSGPRRRMLEHRHCYHRSSRGQRHRRK